MNKRPGTQDRHHVQYGSESPSSIEDVLASLKKENQILLDEYEAVISRANALEVEAEIAHLELNQVFNSIDDAMRYVNRVSMNNPTGILSNIANKRRG